MKKVFALFVLLGMAGIAEAKYNAPEGIVSRSDKIANWQLGNEAWADYRRTGFPLTSVSARRRTMAGTSAAMCAGPKRRESICRRNNSLRLRIPTKTVSFPIPNWPSLSENSATRTRGCIIKARGADC